MYTLLQTLFFQLPVSVTSKPLSRASEPLSRDSKRSGIVYCLTPLFETQRFSLMPRRGQFSTPLINPSILISTFTCLGFQSLQSFQQPTPRNTHLHHLSSDLQMITSHFFQRNSALSNSIVCSTKIMMTSGLYCLLSSSYLYN